MGKASGGAKLGRLISRRALYFSLALAVIAEMLFITAQIVQHPAQPLMFIATLGWPFYYAGVVGVAFGIVHHFACRHQNLTSVFRSSQAANSGPVDCRSMTDAVRYGADMRGSQEPPSGDRPK